MTSATFALAALSACGMSLAGMTALSLAMDRHHWQVTGRHDVPRRTVWVCRVAGAVLLAVSLWPCVAAWGPTVGFLAWWGFLTAGAAATVTLLTYRQHWTLRVAAASALAAVAALGLL
ncbi:MAG: DUF3325 domain-containing protein [Comamonadaceae bacterium]|nr:MAG: DUF3325 domain-containing protein [Comamonadaceae bacterium]